MAVNNVSKKLKYLVSTLFGTIFLREMPLLVFSQIISAINLKNSWIPAGNYTLKVNNRNKVIHLVYRQHFLKN